AAELRAEGDPRPTSPARVLSLSTVRHGRATQRPNEASALETSSAHAVVDGFPDPPPQPVLASGVRIGLYVRPPAHHHFAFDGPQPHALTRNDPSPVVADLGARIDQPKRNVPGEKFQHTEVDRLERVTRAGLEVGNVGE